MNASSDVISQSKINHVVLFYGLTSCTAYGWREHT